MSRPGSSRRQGTQQWRVSSCVLCDETLVLKGLNAALIVSVQNLGNLS